ncbi:MAG: hypothetical protein FK732_05320 [Asgard group archaeon]|nr:hypothetical protein [Asgard group archaeon]
MQDCHLVYEFRKNALEKVKVELCNYRGIDVINIRVYYNANIAGNNWKPSPKGITMSADRIPELKKALDKALEEWKKQGYSSN